MPMLYYPCNSNAICCGFSEIREHRRIGLPARRRSPGALVGLIEFGYVERSRIAIEGDRS